MKNIRIIANQNIRRIHLSINGLIPDGIYFTLYFKMRAKMQEYITTNLHEKLKNNNWL